MLNSTQGRRLNKWGMRLSSFLIMLFVPYMSYAAPDLSVTSTSGAPGSTVSVSVLADFSQPVDSIGFTLVYDSTLLTVSSVTAGSADTSWFMDDNANTAGKVLVGGFNTGGTASSLSGSGQQIAIINFTVNNPPGSSNTSSALATNSVTFDAATITQLTSGTFTLIVNPVNYTLTLNVSGNGTVSANPNSSTYQSGSQVVLTATPSSGYQFSSWSQGASGSTNPLTLTMNANTSVTANFITQTETITASAGSNGSISPSGSVNVPYGGNQIFTLTPATGYTAQLTVDGTPVTLTNNTYTLSNVTTTHTLAASFSQNTFTITASAGSNGSITPASATIAYGGSQTFTATPATGYTASLTVDGTPVTLTNNTYTLSNVTATHTLSATFTQDTFAITTTAGSNGSISPMNPSIGYGDSQIFTVTPNTGYTASLTEDGTPVTLTNNTYDLTNVTGTHTLAATFTQDTFTITTTAGSNGSISPMNPSIAYGGSQLFTVTPATGYTASLKLDGTTTALTNNTYNLTNVTATHTVAVTFSQNTYTITTTAGSNGSISPTNPSIAYGGSQLFTVTPATGYTASLTVDGTAVALTNNTYNLTNVTATHTLAVTFSQNTYTITTTAGSNGSISPMNPSIAYGGSQLFTVTPATGYTASLKLDGTAVALTNNTYNLTNVTATHTVAVTFSQNTYTITTTAGSNGSISPMNPSIAYGGSQLFTVTPATGYTASLKLDGTTVALTNNTYNLTNVTATHTVAVTFSQNTYTITTTAGSNGSISPTNPSIAYGGSQLFTVTPATGYTASLTVDGTAVTLTNNTYNLTNVTAIHTLAVTFTLNTYAISASAGSNGSISPLSVIIPYGGSQLFTVTPATGYTASLKLDGTVAALTNNTYDLTNVTATHTLSATFIQNTYVITTTAGSNGSISPMNPSIAYGGSQLFTVTPATGYSASLTVDGTAQALTNNTYNLTNVTATHTVAVTFAQNTYTITTAAGSNGSISPMNPSIAYGGSQLFTVTPVTGYTASLTVDGTAVALTNNTYNLTNVTATHTVTATFSQNTYAITTTAGSNGSISPVHPTVAYGGSQLFTVTPATGYTASLTVDGTPVALTNNTYNLTNVTANHTVAVTFSQNTYAITTTAGSNGSISPMNPTIAYGGSQLFTVTPATGYTASLTVDGTAVALTNNTYNLTNVTANHTVAVTFAQNSYTITATAGSHGAITPTSATVAYGGSQTFTVTPATGYTAQLTLDGSAVALTNNSFTLTNVTANHTLAATFTQNTYAIAASAGNNGSISPTSAIVPYGGSQTFTVTPNTGYSAQLTVDNVPVALTNNTYTLTNVTVTHTVSATFTQNTFTVTATAGSNGSITPTSATIAFGGSQTFTVTPATGYTAQLTLDGVPVTLTNNSYTLTNVTAVHALAASFTQNTYNVTATAGNNGSIAPTDATINSGGSQTFTVTPNAGYTAQLTVDGVPVVLTNNSYTLTNVMATHVLTASFSQNTYTITAAAGSNGSVAPTSATVNYGGSQTFTVTPDTGYTAQLTVDGTPVALTNNSYTITNVTAVHALVVSFSRNTYNITATAGANGSISPTSTTLNYGSSQTFTLTPATGYSAQLTVDGAPVILTNNSYTLTNVTAVHVLAASFTQNTYNVTATAGSNGSITPMSVSVPYGGSQTFTVTPATGYAAQLTLDGNTVALTNNSYTLTNVTAVHVLAASFTQNTYALAASAGSNGSITPTSATVNYGGSQTFTVTPNIGYTAQLTMDGAPVTLTNNSYTLNNVTANHTLAATFTQNTYSITATAGSNGSISPTSSTVAYGNSQTFTVTSSVGYTAQLTLDGTPVTLTNNSYTLANVIANHTLAVSFAQNTYDITASAVGSNGSITPTSATVAYGASQTFVVTPATGFTAQLTVDGTAVVLTNNSYTLSNVTAVHTLIASFIPIVYYNITATAGSNGSITPTSARVASGSSQTFTVTPNTGYTAQVMVDGTPVTLSNNAFVLNNITSDHAVAVSFTIITYPMTITAGSNGTITPTSATISYGGSQIFTLTPNTGYTAQLTVDGSVVTLNNNSYTLSNVIATHTIAASFTQITYLMSISAGAGGSLTPTTATIPYGGSQTFTVTPDLGYTTNQLTVDGTPVTLTNNSYTLTNVTATHTLAASFTQLTYAITATAGSNGSISPTSVTAAPYGSSQVFTATPIQGYGLSQVLDNGSPLPFSGNSFTLTNITAIHTIVVSFAPTFTVSTIVENAGGTITPSGFVNVVSGANQTFTLMPNDGYTAQVTLDGSPVTLTSNSFTLSDVTAAHVVMVSFTSSSNASGNGSTTGNNITLNVSAGEGGSITPTGSVSVASGGSQVFTITPNLGFSAAQLLVDGTPVPLTNNTYTLINITSSHTIMANFTVNGYGAAGVGGTVSPSGDNNGNTDTNTGSSYSSSTGSNTGSTGSGASSSSGSSSSGSSETGSISNVGSGGASTIPVARAEHFKSHDVVQPPVNNFNDVHVQENIPSYSPPEKPVAHGAGPDHVVGILPVAPPDSSSPAVAPTVVPAPDVLPAAVVPVKPTYNAYTNNNPVVAATPSVPPSTSAKPTSVMDLIKNYQSAVSTFFNKLFGHNSNS